MFTDQAPVTTIITPYDPVKPEDLLASFLAQAKGPIVGSFYEANLPVLYDGLVAASARGCPLFLLFDASEESNGTEKGMHADFVAKIPQGSSWVGTTAFHHAILHLKVLIINAPHGDYAPPPGPFSSITEALDAGGSVVWSGSWNFSKTASFQANNVDIIASLPRAQAFCQAIVQMQDWIAQNESKLQVT